MVSLFVYLESLIFASSYHVVLYCGPYICVHPLGLHLAADLEILTAHP